MGRSILSFRQLIEIERLNWSNFKIELPLKKKRLLIPYLIVPNFILLIYLMLHGNNIPYGKLFFVRSCKKWKGLIYALHNGEGKLLLKMISEICQYNEYFSSTINKKDLKSNVTLFFTW